MFTRSALASRFKLHPATAIALWLFFAVWLEFAQPSVLIIATIALLPWLRGQAASLLWRYLRRTRWLLASLLLIHAYTLPGDSLWPAWGAWSPSVEGVHQGLARTWRMGLLLAALSLLMSGLARAELLLGICRILAPFGWLGLDAERIAVRLWLTLHYAEAALADTEKIPLQARIDQLRRIDSLAPSTAPDLALPDAHSGWADYLAFGLALTAGALLL